MDGNALVDNGIVLHVGHAEHPVDFSNAQPVENVGHESLEAHVLHTRNVLRSLEVFAGPIFSSFPCIVHKVFGHFPKGSALFAEVNDHAATAFLRFFDGLFDAERQVGAACANVRPEHVASIALVVDTEGEPGAGV